MRSRSVVIVTVILGAVLAACTPGRTSSTGTGQTSPAIAAADDMLFLSNGEGLRVLDARTGSVLLDAAGAVPAPDWSHVFAASVEGGGTVVRVLTPGVDAPTTSTTVSGALAIAAAGPDGAIALVDRGPSNADPWEPISRSATDITVAHPLSGAKPERFHLQGNFVPEAFSADGESLFMLQYLPPRSPVKYRVTSLYLDKGKVWPVYGRDKQPVENMTATRLQQEPALDGSALYTLYTNQPPGYASGIDRSQASSDAEVAFIHTLSLEGGFAECVALPRSFGSIRPEAAALAVAPDRVYAIDAAHGRIAVMDASRLKVIRTSRVDLGPVGSGMTSAGVSSDGRTLFVATGANLTAIDTSTLRPRSATSVAGSVTGLGFSADGARLYLSWAGHVEALDPSTGEQNAMLSVPEPDALAHVVTVG